MSVFMIGISAALMNFTSAVACIGVSKESKAFAPNKEDAIIVWDAERKLEHFIRRASFEDAPSDFGFIVPTPTRPEIHSVDQEVFSRITTYLRWRNPPRHANRGLRPAVNSAAKRPDVEVLERKRVGNMEAVILAASDSVALSNWLKKYGYASRKNLAEWAQPYVAQDWKFTAFRYISSDKVVKTEAVRLTFKTDKPFYPYREPMDAPEQVGRALQVFFFGPEQIQGKLGDSMGAQDWNANEVFSDEMKGDWIWFDPDGNPDPIFLLDLAEAKSSRLPFFFGLFAGVLPSEQIPKRAVLTHLIDNSSSRSRNDVFFYSVPKKKMEQEQPALKPAAQSQ